MTKPVTFLLMDKETRYALIQSMLRRASAGRLEAGKQDVEEEAKLAVANNDDNSIVEEENSATFINPALAAAIETPRLTRGESEEETLLTEAEKQHLSRELGRPVSLSGIKRVVQKDSSEDIPSIENMDLVGLQKFAEEIAQS